MEILWARALPGFQSGFCSIPRQPKGIRAAHPFDIPPNFRGPNLDHRIPAFLIVMAFASHKPIAIRCMPFIGQPESMPC